MSSANEVLRLNPVKKDPFILGQRIWENVWATCFGSVVAAQSLLFESAGVLRNMKGF